MALAVGKEDLINLTNDGFSPADVQSYEQETRQLLLDDGFTRRDVDQYFGVGEPDLNKLAEYTIQGFQQADPQLLADDPIEAFWAGLQISNTGLQFRQRLPDSILAEDVGFGTRLANQAGMLIGDFPLILTGFAGGFFAGGGPLSPVTAFTLAGFGSAALPEFHRQILMDQFEATMNGDGYIWTSEDFLERLGGIMLETGKVGVSGAVGGRAGQLVSQNLIRAGTQAGTAMLGRGLTEVTTFTGVLSGLNGEVPSLQDFAVGVTFAVGMAGGMKAVKMGSNVTRRAVAQSMDIYQKTGLTPEAQAKIMSQSLHAVREVLSMDPNGRARPTTFFGFKLKEPKPSKVKDADNPGKFIDRELPRNFDLEIAEVNVDLAIWESRRTTFKTEFKLSTVEKRIIALKEKRLNLIKAKGDADLPKDGIPEERSKLSEDEAVIADMITDRPKTGRLRDMIAEFDPHDAYTRIVREFHPLEVLQRDIEAEGGVFVPDKNTPVQQATQTYSSALRASHFLKYGPVEYGTNRKLNGPSYFDAMEQVRKDGGTGEGLTYWRLAKYTIERASRDIETGIDLALARRVVHDGEAKYAKSEKMIQQVKNSVLEYVRKSGLITAEMVTILKKLNEFHIPTQRLLGDAELSGTPGRGRGLKVRIPFRRASGSKSKIIDPVLTEIQNMHLMIALADRQAVAHTIIGAVEQLAKTNPEGALGIGAKSKKSTQRIKIDDKETVKILTEYGIDLADAKQFAAGMEPMILYRKVQKTLAKNEILFFRNGKPEVWVFADESVASVFRGADPLETGLGIALATKLAEFKRLGLTSPPDFPVRNILFRDIIMKSILQEGFNPLTDPIAAAMEIWGQSEGYQRFLREGAAGASIVAMSVDQVSRDARMLRDTSVTGRVINEIRNPLDLVRKFTEFLDNSVRFGGFRKDLARGVPVPKAVTHARENSLDLMQRGSSQLVNLIARTTPFFRPGILGIDQIVRGIKAHPKRFALRSLMAITAPEVFFYMLNLAVDEMLKDDPNRVSYNDQPRWLKDTYWHIPVPVGDTGFFIRFPKPMIMGQLFGTTVHRFLDWSIKDDPRAFKDFHKTIMAQFIPSFIPTIIDPLISLTFDVNLFTGRPLTPSSLEGASNHMQYTTYTSAIGKRLSQIMYQGTGGSMSPIHIDAIVRGYLGTAGATILKELDVVVPNTPVRPSRSFYELPFIKSFFSRQPGQSAKVITDFYDKYGQFQTRATDLRLAIKRLNPKEINQASEFLSAFVGVENYAATNSVIIELIRGVHRNEELTGDEKRAKIDSHYALLRTISRAGLKTMDALVLPGKE